MEYTIRSYSKKDYAELKRWWVSSKETVPPEDALSEESTFILELDNVPALSITVYLTNSKQVSYLENFIGNPDLKGDSRRKASQIIVDAACGFAKSLGYKRILCLAQKDKLKTRYTELGMQPVADNLSGFVREL